MLLSLTDTLDKTQLVYSRLLPKKKENNELTEMRRQ